MKTILNTPFGYREYNLEFFDTPDDERFIIIDGQSYPLPDEVDNIPSAIIFSIEVCKRRPIHFAGAE